MQLRVLNLQSSSRKGVRMPKVAVGMSGGVDSAVAAYLLKQQGYDVIGVTLRTSESDTRCCEIDDARACAEAIGIPYRVFNCSGEFDRKVVAPFVESYCSGQTPNPCVICNRQVKWEQMIYAANVLGADYIATGHYAFIEQLKNSRWSVRTADCAAKDQTYMLYRLSQEQLARTLMPLGSYSKEQVRAIAAEAGIPVAQKSDSQEICFVPDDDYAKFIKEWLAEASDKAAAGAGGFAAEESGKTAEQQSGKAADGNPAGPGSSADGPLSNAGPFTEGSFVDLDGNVLGRHKGIINYTVGQRKGLGIALGFPAYVVRIDKEKNQVVLGRDEDLWTRTVYCRDVNFMGLAPDIGCADASFASGTDVTGSVAEQSSFRAKAKIRYQHRAADCTVSIVRQGDEPILMLQFDEPVRAAAPGQSAVVYDDNGCVLCGGIICQEAAR